MPDNSYYQRLLSMLGDKVDPNDTQGIQPSWSPVDLLAGGIGSKLAEAAGYAPSAIGGSTTGINAGNQAMAANNDANIARNAALKALIAKQGDTGDASAIDALGANMPDIAPKPTTVEGYLQNQEVTKPITNNVTNLRPTDITAPMGPTNPIQSMTKEQYLDILNKMKTRGQ